MSAMRVGIVSDQPLWRDALVALLTQELHAQAVETGCLQEDYVRDGPLDLLLLDLPASIDPAAWIASTMHIEAHSRVFVVPERDIILARIAHGYGFRALLPKTTEPKLMVAALLVVLAGGEYFPCFEAVGKITGATPRKLGNGLTKRQIEVLSELGLGRTNKEISTSLGISIATVKLDVQAILNVTGARNRTEAASHLLHIERDLSSES